MYVEKEQNPPCFWPALPRSPTPELEITQEKSQEWSSRGSSNPGGRDGVKTNTNTNTGRGTERFPTREYKAQCDFISIHYIDIDNIKRELRQIPYCSICSLFDRTESNLWPDTCISFAVTQISHQPCLLL